MSAEKGSIPFILQVGHSTSKACDDAGFDAQTDVGMGAHDATLSRS